MMSEVPSLGHSMTCKDLKMLSQPVLMKLLLRDGEQQRSQTPAGLLPVTMAAYVRDPPGFQLPPVQVWIPPRKREYPGKGSSPPCLSLNH